MDDNELAPQDHVGLWELAFRENLAYLRQKQKISQTELAKRLQARGLRFHQQTIQRLEDGSRPIRLNEAYAIVDELGTDLQTMTAMSTPKAIELKYGIQQLKRDLGEIDEALASYIRLSSDGFATLLSSIESHLGADEEPPEILLWTASWAALLWDALQSADTFSAKVRRIQVDYDVVWGAEVPPDLEDHYRHMYEHLAPFLERADLYPFGRVPGPTPPEDDDGEHQETS